MASFTRTPRAWLAIAAIVTTAISGCSEALRVKSQPPGATVYLDGVNVGETPMVYRTRQVRPLSYKVEKQGYPAVTGKVGTRVAGGRVVGAIFTLGILAIVRPMRAFVPRVIDAHLGPDDALPPDLQPLATINLYNRENASVISGECEIETGKCWLNLKSGQRCEGELVHEVKGTTDVVGTRVQTVTTGGYGIDSAAAAAGAKIENTNEGVAAFRCPDWILECSLVVGAFKAQGHGDCEDSNGQHYKLMMRPAQDRNPPAESSTGP